MSGQAGKQAAHTESRTFHNRTHIEIVDQSENINSTLMSEMSTKLERPKDESATNPGWTSHNIWLDMPEKSYYYMFMDNRNIHFASYALTSRGLSLAKIYRHKNNPSTYTDTDISDYFMCAQRMTAPPDLPAGWRIKSINVQFGSFVATYTNGTADAIFSAAENIFPSTTTTASASVSTSGLTATQVAATDATSSRVRPAVIAQTAAGPAVVASTTAALPVVVASTAAALPAVVASTTAGLPAVVASTTAGLPAVVASTTAGLPAVVASTTGPAVVAPTTGPAVVVPTTGPAVVVPPAPLAWTSTTLGSSTWSLTSTAMDSSQCAEYIELYNKEFPTKTIACPPVPVAGYDATSKLVVTLVYRSTLPDGLVDVGTVQHSVGMEKKGDTWSGFAAFFAGWIRIDVTGTKMKFTVRTSTGKYEQREVFVKKDPATERQYTFEGGTVQYTGENPFAFSDATSRLIIDFAGGGDSDAIISAKIPYNVAMEKKGDTWTGVQAFPGVLIRIDVTGTKMKFTGPRPDGNQREAEFFVKKDPATDKQYTFEGGTVRYTGENPFEITGLSTGAIVGIVIACVVAVLVVGAVIFFATSSSRRESAGAFFRDRRDAIGRWGTRTRGAISEKLGRRPRQEGPEGPEGPEVQEFDIVDGSSYSESDSLMHDLDRQAFAR